MRNQAAETVRRGARVGFFVTSAAFCAALSAFSWSPRLLAIAAALVVTLVYDIMAGITITTRAIGTDTVHYRRFWRTHEIQATHHELFALGCWNSLCSATITGAGTGTLMYHLDVW